MLQQMLRTFFIGQVVMEAIYEHTVKQWQLEFEQFNQKLTKERHKYAASNGDHSPDVLFEETKRDYEELVSVAQRLLSNSFLLAQEYSQFWIALTFGTVAKLTESAVEATKLPLFTSNKPAEKVASKSRA